MAKKILYCQTCANQVNNDYCTRQLKMEHQSRKYKKCEGYKKYIAPPPKEIIVKQDKPTDYKSLGEFGKFLRRGGHWSFNQVKEGE